MLETIIVGVIVAVALFFTGRSLYRTAQGKERCAGCSSHASRNEDELIELRPPGNKRGGGADQKA